MAGVVVHVDHMGVARVETELVVAPVEVADDLAGVRVEQQLVGVEAVPVFGLPRPAHAQAVELARGDTGRAPVPHVVRARRQRCAGEFTLAAGVDQTEFDFQRVR